MSAKVSDDTHAIPVDAVVRAIDWLGGMDVRVVNMSLGVRAGAADLHRICDAIERYPATLFVAAAGNFGPDVAMIPATCTSSNVIAVASREATSGKGDVTASLPAHTGREGFCANT